MTGTAPRFRAFPFVLAVGVSAALVLAAPFIGELRRAILTRFPGSFVAIMAGIVGVAALAAIVTAVRQIRDRLAPRFGAIAAAFGIAIGYAWYSRTGDPQVDAVERFHFVEYGVITLLFYRAWRPSGDASAIVLPVLSGLLVGTMEEWYQWFIPVRIGEARDVFLNLVAIAAGLIFSIALDPPGRATMSVSAQALRRIGAAAAVLVLAFAAFFDSVHVGHAIEGPGWTFRSCFTADDLEAEAADRAVRWAGQIVPRPPRLSVEDQYMTEGHWHVARRNTAWDEGNAVAAWRENEILERYFAPVLDTPSYLSATGHRWPPEHRADAERRFREAPPAPYESDAHPSAIYVWSAGPYRASAIAVAVLLAAPWMLARARRRAGAPPAAFARSAARRDGEQ